MVSKNNRIKRMEDAAKRQQHFSIRKLTIGAASVLLGTTLWLGTNANVAHAETNDKSNADDDNQAAQESNTEAEQIDTSKAKVIVNASSKSSDDNSKTAENSDASTELDKSVAPSIKTEGNGNTATITTPSSNAETTTKNNAANDQSSVSDSQAGSKATATTGTKQSQNSKTNTNKSANKSKVDSTDIKNSGVVTSATTNTKSNSELNELQNADFGTAGKGITQSAKLSAKLEEVQSIAQGKNTNKVTTNKNTDNNVTNSNESGASIISSDDSSENNGTTITSDVNKVVVNPNSTVGLSGKVDNSDTLKTTLAEISNTSATKLAINALSTNLVQLGSKGITPASEPLTSSDGADSAYTTVTDWSGVESAANNGAKGVNVKGTITASSDLNISSDFTINGIDNATLNLNGNEINNTSTLTLKNVNVNGSIMGSGTVNVEGTVTSTVNDSNGYNLSSSEKSAHFTNTGQTKGYNIEANKVNVEKNATLTINRASVGDGIHLVNSNSTVTVGDYGNLTINMNTGNDLNTTARYHDAGIFAESTGNLTTGYKSVVTLNTSIGQGVSMTGVRPYTTDNDRFGGYTTAQSRSGGSGQISLGKYSTLNFTGRDGFILGDGSNFNVGQYANVHFENKGRGVALDLANNANINIGDHAVTYFHSVGKNHILATGKTTGNPSGSYNGYNYIGVNEGGNITVGEDATFRVILTDRNAGSTVGDEWDDVVQLDSRDANTNAAFTSKKGAIVDIRDDNTNFYAELISFPLGNANSTIDIEDPLLLNLQRYSAGGSTTGWMAGVGGTAINSTSDKYTANLIYMGGTKGKLKIGGTDYVVYQQIKSDGTQQIWTNVNSVEFDKNGFASLNLYDNNANDTTSISGEGLVSGIKANQIRDNQTSPTQSGLKNSPAYGISTMRASHQIWIPHETTTEIKGTHTNTIKYVYADGTPVLDSDGKPLVVTQDLNLSRDLTLDLSADEIKNVQNYALTHTADEVLNYLKSGYSVTKDSGWKITDENGNTVTDPYSAVTSPVEAGYTATIQSSNAPGVTVGADGSSVKANFTMDSANDVVQNGQLSEAYRTNGTTGIPENYVTVVVYNKPNTISSNIKFVDEDENDKELDSASATGSNTDNITFTGATQKLKNLENEGYVYDRTDNTTTSNVQHLTSITDSTFSDSNTAFGKYDASKNGSFTVYLKHGYTTVDKTNNHGIKNTATVTRNVNYTVNGQTSSQLPSQTESASFTGTGYIDTVTKQLVDVVNGQIVKNSDGTIKEGSLTWTADGSTSDSATLNGYDAPTLAGYHVNSSAITVTPTDQKTANVTDSGAVNQITVNHNSSDVTVTIPLVADDQQAATLKIVDDTTGQQLGTTITANGRANTSILFATGESTVQGYLDSGNYVFVSVVNDTTNSTLSTTSYTDAATKFGNYDSDTSTTQGFTVHLKHAAQPITPDTPSTDIPKNTPADALPSALEKKVELHVNYVNQDGSTFTGKVPDNATQTLTFDGTAYVDKITGQLVNAKQEDGKWVVDGSNTATPTIAWALKGGTADSGSFTAVTSPDETGYKVIYVTSHRDGDNVAAITGITHNSATPIEVTVLYEKVQPAADETVTVKYYDDTDPSTNLSSYDKTITGKAGSDLNYATQPSITELENKGYDLVSDSFTAANLGGKMPAKGGNYEVHLVHKTTTVTPDKPGKPGEPVDPNNPNGPKYPDGTDENAIKRTGTQTIHYTGAGDKTPADNKETFTFTRNVTFDDVTGKIISTTPWNETSHTFDKVDTPVVDGYHADKKNAGGTIITPDDLNKTETVTYSPNGKIIPVDPSGKPIPGADTPTYPTDPTDPTKVEPNEPVPTVPGKTPDTPTVTPKNPGQNTNVIYRSQEAQVIYRDINDGEANAKELATSGDLSGKAGDKINYSTADEIKTLEDKGYVLVKNGFDPDGITQFFDNVDDSKGDSQIFYVDFKHGTTTVTPKNPQKPGQPINPNDPNGPKWPDGTDAKSLTKNGTETIHYVYGDGKPAAPDNTQTVEFDHSITYDKVTGKVIKDNGWTPSSKTFNDVTSPTIDGYTPSETTVKGDTVTPDSPKTEHTVTYAKNGTVIKNHQENDASQIVKYVDEDGNELATSKRQDFVFNYTGDTYDQSTGKLISNGTWNATSHNFTAEDVPVINGYVAVSGYTKTSDGKYVAGGFTATDNGSKADNNRPFTVVYHRIGKIIPVGPDGKTPIPDAPTPEYKNDPKDPTKVTPNEPVPDIPGYTPETPTVTPTDPKNDTPVIYNPKAGDVTTVVHYVDQDDNNKVIQSSRSLSGKEGSQINYSSKDDLQKLIDQGYELVKNGYDPNGTAPNFDSKVPVYTITLKHGTQTINPDNPGNPGQPINPNDPNGPKWGSDTDKDHLQVNGSQTIHYTGAGSNTPKDSVTNITFNHEEVVDKVTGKVVKDNGWTIKDDKGNTIGTGENHKFDNVPTPDVPGYTPDKYVAGGKTATVENPNVVDTVHYNENYTPYVPDQPSNPTNPSNPTSPTTPTTPKQPTDASKPTEPTEPDIPDNPEPTPEHHEHHHNHHDNTPEPVRPSTPTNTNPGYNYNFVPHSQNGGYNTNFMPHGQSVNGWNGNIGPHGEHVDANGNIIAPDGEVVGYVDAEGNPHYTKNILDHLLPQTGENNTEDIAAAVAGGMAVSIGLIGLAGVRKRRRD